MYRQIVQVLNKNGRVKVVTSLDGKHKGAKRIYSSNGQYVDLNEGHGDWILCEKSIQKCNETRVIDIEGTKMLVEIFQRKPYLIVCGGGHVSVPVVRIGKMLGFHIILMDDREEFANADRFPEADEIVCDAFSKMEDRIPVYENSYYVVLTRGHAGDESCAEVILKRPFAYFGMIGSKTKVALTRESLLKKGYSPESLACMHAPIGIKIGGQMPAEIAVSIMAEIVKEKNQQQIAYLDEDVEQGIVGNKKGVMLTIISKSGSSPRGIGSKRLVQMDGTAFGSIGGGTVEYEASKEALTIDKIQIRNYDLSLEDANRLGMICGGHVEVLFEPVGGDCS